MPTMTINSDSLTDIADSIREKLGVETTYLPSEMAAAIDSITGGGGEAEYVLVEWIRSDGTQVIDTGERVTAATEIYAEAVGSSGSGSNGPWLFGVEATPSSGDFMGVQYNISNGRAYFYKNIAGTTSVAMGSCVGKRTQLSLTPSNMSAQPINGSASSSTSGSMVASNDTLPLFVIADYNSEGTYTLEMTYAIQATLYKFSINGKDFYPCKRISDGAYGLYNTTDETFHGDVMGGNPFTAGEEIVPIG